MGLCLLEETRSPGTKRVADCRLFSAVLTERLCFCPSLVSGF